MRSVIEKANHSCQ